MNIDLVLVGAALGVLGAVIILLIVKFVRAMSASHSNATAPSTPFPTIDIALADQRKYVHISRNTLSGNTMTIPLRHWLSLMNALEIPVQENWLTTPMNLFANCTHDRCMRVLQDPKKRNSLSFHVREYVDQLADLSASATNSDLVICELATHGTATRLPDEEACRQFVNNLLAGVLTRQH